MKHSPLSLIAKSASLLLALGSLSSAWSATVTLTWDPSSATNLAGYRIYYGGLSATYTNSITLGNVTETTVDGLACSSKYFFAATALSSSGGESIYSNELQVQVPSAITNYNIVLGKLAQTFDGTPKPAVASTVPAGGSVLLTYNGSVNPPVAAGAYSIIATIVSTNGSGSATNTLLVSKAVASVSLGALNQNYDGLPKPVSVSTTPPGLAVSLSYNGTPTPPTSAGTYTVTATITDPNYLGSASNQLTVNKASALLTLAGLSQVYDGTPKIVTATSTPANLGVTLTYSGQPAPPINAGNYQVVATLNSTNYCATITNVLCVNKATATVSLTNLSQSYDGQAKTVVPVTQPNGLATLVTYGGNTNSPTNAGVYEVICTVVETNYCGSSTNNLTIAAAPASIVIDGLIQTFDGLPKPVSCSTSPTNLAVSVAYNGTSAAPSNAGTYQVLCSINDPNYYGSATNVLSIGKAPAIVVITNLVQTYDKNPKQVLVTTSPAGLGVQTLYNGSVNPPTGAGSYPIIVSVTNENYCGIATNTLVINKADAVIRVSGLNQTYDGTAKAVSVTTSPVGLNSLVFYNGKNLAPTNAGTYNTIVYLQDSNYSGFLSTNLLVSPQPCTITLTPLTQAYTGAPRPVTATTSPAGALVLIQYNGSATPPTAAGVYTVVARISDLNHCGSVTNTLSITNTVKSAVTRISPVGSEPASAQILLSWQPDFQGVVIYHSHNLSDWEILTGEATSENSLLVNQEPGSHFFRGFRSSAEGMKEIPLFISQSR